MNTYKNKFKNAIIVLIFSFAPIYVNAGTKEDFVEKIRPFLVDILGMEWTEKLIGRGSSIELPSIPHRDDNLRDEKRIGVKDRSKNNLSDEDKERYNYYFIREVYEVTRKTRPTEADLSIWMNVLGQNGSREGVYRALVLDKTYKGLENYENPASSTGLKFALDFFSKYLNLNISKDKLSEMNIFRLKRVLVEKALEVVDLLYKNEEDLWDWYAVFSSEMASSYSDVWKNKIRNDISKKRHRRWAKKVSLQYLKSEVIIKLHKVLNFLEEN